MPSLVRLRWQVSGSLVARDVMRPIAFNARVAHAERGDKCVRLRFGVRAGVVHGDRAPLTRERARGRFADPAAGLKESARECRPVRRTDLRAASDQGESAFEGEVLGRVRHGR